MDRMWVIRDTTEKVTSGIWMCFGSRGTIPMRFATREDAEAELSRYSPEYVAKLEVIHLDDFYARAKTRSRERLHNTGSAL